jgi:hypothetical protein
MTKMNPDNTIKTAYQHLLAQFEPNTINSVLFTSFNLSSGFFENNVLPLVGDLMIDNADQMAQASSTQINKNLDKTGVTVICDSNTHPGPKGHYRYGLLSVHLPHGFFHPKIIVATGKLKSGDDAGKDGAMLMVTSANLTLSGWGLNREVAGICRVGSQQQEALIPLLEWIKARADEQIELMTQVTDADVKEEGKIRENLTNIMAFIKAHCNQHLPDEPNFHTRIPKAENPATTFLSTMLPSATSPFKTCQIVSPFWSNNKDIKSRLTELNSEQITLVPSINNAGEYQLPQSIRDENPKFKYQQFRDLDRYTHAKSIKLTTDKTQHYLIGSANFTQAAMGSIRKGNIEAMLHYALPEPTPELHAMLPLNNPIWANDKESAEDAPTVSPYTTVASYDWQTKIFSCVLQCTAEEFKNVTKVHFDQQTLEFSKQEKNLYLAKLAITLPSPIYCFKLDYVEVDDNKQKTPQTSLGLVTQLNAHDDQLGYLPKPDLNTILAQLRRLDAQSGSGRAGGYTLESAATNDDPEDEITDVFDFFSMFQAFYKLRSYFAEHPDINPFTASTNSLSLLYRAVNVEYEVGQTEDQHLIKQFILLSELQVTADSFKEKHPGEDTDTLLTDIAQSLKLLTPKFKTLIKKSSLLKQFLDIDEDNQQVSDIAMKTVLNWFKTQLGACK